MDDKVRRNFRLIHGGRYFEGDDNTKPEEHQFYYPDSVEFTHGGYLYPQEVILDDGDEDFEEGYAEETLDEIEEAELIEMAKKRTHFGEKPNRTIHLLYPTLDSDM